jgi:hypothetical protein
MNADTSRLAAQQRALLALVKDRPVPQLAAHPAQRRPAAEPYFDRVRDSRGLAMVRTIRASWLRFDLQRYAPLTSGMLTHAGRLEAELAQLGRDPGTPSAIDALGLHFVEQHLADTDPLIAAVAATERALILLARGDRTQHEVSWAQDPVPVLSALLASQSPPASTPGNFRVVVSHLLPELIQVQGVL